MHPWWHRLDSDPNVEDDIRAGATLVNRLRSLSHG
jgi:hypothetical protein